MQYVTSAWWVAADLVETQTVNGASRHPKENPLAQEEIGPGSSLP